MGNYSATSYNPMKGDPVHVLPKRWLIEPCRK